MNDVGARNLGYCGIANGQGCGRIEWTVVLGDDREISIYERHDATVRYHSRCVGLDADGINSPM